MNMPSHYLYRVIYRISPPVKNHLFWLECDHSNHDCLYHSPVDFDLLSLRSNHNGGRFGGERRARRRP